MTLTPHQDSSRKLPEDHFRKVPETDAPDESRTAQKKMWEQVRQILGDSGKWPAKAFQKPLANDVLPYLSTLLAWEPPPGGVPRDKPAGMVDATPINPKLKKEIDDKIKDLESEKFAVREAAHSRLRQIGLPALRAVNEAIISSPDAEVRRHAREIREEIISDFRDETPNWKQGLPYTRHINDLRKSAEQEVAQSGNLSNATRQRYQRLIEESRNEDLHIPEGVWTKRKDDLTKQTADPSRTKEEHLEARRQLGELNAATNMSQSAQAQLDFAELLIKAKDNKAAQAQLTEAIKRHPELEDNPSFRFLAIKSGAVDNKAFCDAVDKASGEKDEVRGWGDGRREKGYAVYELAHLRHNIDRFGLTPRLDGELQDYESRMQAKKDSFFESRAHGAQMMRAEQAALHGERGKAISLMTDLLRKDSRFLDWCDAIAKDIDAPKDKAYQAAHKAAEERRRQAEEEAKKQFDRDR
jgi:hypothetical protein